MILKNFVKKKKENMKVRKIMLKLIIKLKMMRIPFQI